MPSFLRAVVVAGVSLAFLSQAMAVTITSTEELPPPLAGPSSGDALQGLLSINHPPGKDGSVRADNYAYLTDGSPDASHFATDNTGTHDTIVNFVTFDLGTFDTSKYLQFFDVWIGGERRTYLGSLSISNDGRNFTVIPGTKEQAGFTTLGAQGRVRYEFGEQEVPTFRYLRFTSHADESTYELGAYPFQPSISEMDAFFAPVPEPGVAALSVLGGVIFFGYRRSRQ